VLSLILENHLEGHGNDDLSGNDRLGEGAALDSSWTSGDKPAASLTRH
jgi:hypothetical protein